MVKLLFFKYSFDKHSIFVFSVVFQLHDTFRNPKRVLKEPPFIVKESGYAGFIIPIEIYLKNKDEPKKFQISYDLHLQQSGPPINKIIRHVEVFRNPSDDFRKKLLKGGAVSIIFYLNFCRLLRLYRNIIYNQYYIKQ